MAVPTRQEAARRVLREAESLYHLGELEAGHEKLKEAREQAGGEFSLLSDVAGVYWKNGRLADAAEVLEAILDELGRNPNVVTSGEQALLMTRLGAARIRLGDLGAAQNVLRDALELSDDGYSALQLGNALRYQGARDQAGGHLQRAYDKAKAERDGGLAIAALCGQGELALDQGEAKQAAERFGQALGLTEFTQDETLTVAPLAGLSHAHALWGNRAKAGEIGRKALERAERAADTAGKARALLALGTAGADISQLELAEKEATTAPHKPLALRVLVARLELAFDDDLYPQARTLARKMTMHGDLNVLERLKLRS